MGFSVSKALVYGLALFAGMIAGLSITGDGWSWPRTLVVAALAGVLGGTIFGYMMRDAAVDIAGASPQSVDAALAASWGLRGFKRVEAEGGAAYVRGMGIFGDRFTATPNATGVTLRGPYNIIRLVKNKAVG